MANYDRGAFYKNYLLNVSFVGESDVTARRLFASFVPFFFSPFTSSPILLTIFRSKGVEKPEREDGRRVPTLKKCSMK